MRYFQVGHETWPDDAIRQLALAMIAPAEPKPTEEGQPDAEENRGDDNDPGITAGYTYLGQFIDHDLTLDPTSNLRGRPLRPEELAALIDFRSPRFDLDCLYGRGPADQPYLYDSDEVHLLLGTRMSGNPGDSHASDVPRAQNGRALIGDPRNDENRIIAQLQSMMLRFHNRMVDRHAQSDATLSMIKQQVRWHYQWAIVHDFLPTVIQRDVLQSILPGRTDDPTTTDDRPVFTIPCLKDRAERGIRPLLDRMPVEFSVAAYRFGHSMIRPIYRINSTIERRPIFSPDSDEAGNLGGMRPIPQDWAIDWQNFIDIDHGISRPADQHVDQVPRTPQFAYKIDTSLVEPLGLLPSQVATGIPSLAERNLLRGVTFSLPTGEAVAKLLGFDPLPPERILIGKATGDATDRRPISDIAHGVFVGKTPLWVYVLAEAWATSWEGVDPQDAGAAVVRLGPVGGHLVAETIMAILAGDPDSYVNQSDQFRPEPELCHGGAFGLSEILNVALGRA